jgi:hypothetical protein
MGFYRLMTLAPITVVCIVMGAIGFSGWQVALALLGYSLSFVLMGFVRSES